MRTKLAIVVAGIGLLLRVEGGLDTAFESKGAGGNPAIGFSPAHQKTSFSTFLSKL